MRDNGLDDGIIVFVTQVKAMLHGMSSLNRTGDVSIFFHPGTGERTVQCPFSLGPLELVVSKARSNSQLHRIPNNIQFVSFLTVSGNIV